MKCADQWDILVWSFKELKGVARTDATSDDVAEMFELLFAFFSTNLWNVFFGREHMLCSIYEGEGYLEL